MGKFWLDDEDDSGLDPIKNEAIVLVEEKLGVELPALYKKLIRKQNGGYIKRTVFPIDFSTSSVENYIEVDRIMGIGEAGILDSPYLIKEWELRNDLVLLNGEGHTWVAMDYRGKTKDPSIIYIDVEEEVEIQLASSFSEFIEGLQEEDINTEDSDLGEDDITKEQAESVFKMSDDEGDILRTITNYHIAENEIDWMLDQLTFLLDRNNSEGIAEEIADFLMVHSFLRGVMDNARYTLLMDKLKALPYTDLPYKLEMIEAHE